MILWAWGVRNRGPRTPAATLYAEASPRVSCSPSHARAQPGFVHLSDALSSHMENTDSVEQRSKRRFKASFQTTQCSPSFERDL